MPGTKGATPFTTDLRMSKKTLPCLVIFFLPTAFLAGFQTVVFLAGLRAVVDFLGIF